MPKKVKIYFNRYFLSYCFSITEMKLYLQPEIKKYKSMTKQIYHLSERCSYSIAADLLFLSERSAARYIKRLRSELGYGRKDYLTVRAFCEFYHIENDSRVTD